MRYKELKIRFISFTGTPDPYFTISSTVLDNDDNYGLQFVFVQKRLNPFEVTISASNQNQKIKEAFDLDLVPLGYETDIDDDFVYLYLTSPDDQFYFVIKSGVNINSEIDNSHSPSLKVLSAPGTDELLNAFNDNVIIFKRNNSEKLEITFNGKYPITLYPSPTNEYYLNLKEPAKALINQNKFKDEITPDIENEGYVYPDNSMYLKMKISIDRVVGRQRFNAELNYQFVKAVEQISNFKDTIFKANTDKGYLMLPRLKTEDFYRVNYYEGYPMDVSLYLETSNINESKQLYLKLKNTTTGHQANVSWRYFVSRLYFSQGSQNFTIDDILPIQTGVNRIELEINRNKSLLLYVNKKESKCAPYFKFYRNRGGWGYIRFEKEFSIKDKIRDQKEVSLDFDGIQNTLTRSLVSEKQSTIEMKFQTEALEDWEMQNFKDFVRSPRVEMYVQDLFQKQEKDSWVGVKVSGNSLDTKSLKTKFNREQVKIEFKEYNLSI